jgi:hypothetical protein
MLDFTRNCIILVFYIIPLDSSSIGQCLSFTALTSKTERSLTCFGTVDYTFFLPIGLTLDEFEILARSKLNNEELNILPTKCKLSIKKAVCSNIYLKCPPNDFNLSLPMTWNYKIFSDIGRQYPLPYQQPCVSICHDANKDCLGLLNLLNLGLNCLERHDYSNGAFNNATSSSYHLFPYTYDHSNNVSLCNNMPATVQVADTLEPYVYAESGSGGVCTGIITSLYVPQGIHTHSK